MLRCEDPLGVRRSTQRVPATAHADAQFAGNHGEVPQGRPGCGW
jgi:hypothetical protein